MLSLEQLTRVVDSLKKKTDSVKYRGYREINPIVPFTYADSVIKKNNRLRLKFNNVKELVTDSVKNVISSSIISKATSFKNQVDFISYDYLEQQKQLRLHDLERHRKFALSFACIVLFLIGAPLGSIIRKGGIGLPLVISVLFFIIFHITNTTGEKMVKEGVALPGFGMWLSTMLLIPVGIFLTYKAMQDSQLFNSEFYYRILRRLKMQRLLKEKPKG
jgi:lipopolysaccharide export system permease protein